MVHFKGQRGHVDRILHSDVTNFPGHTEVGAEVTIDANETLRAVIDEIRDLAHRYVFVRGTFHSDDPSAIEFNKQRAFPEAGFTADSPLWVHTCLPHNELNIETARGRMLQMLPILDEAKVDAALENSRQLDHILVFKTLKTQEEFRENVTAVTHFPAVFWSVRQRLRSFVDSLIANNWGKKEGLKKEELSKYQQATARLESGPIKVFDINHVSQYMLRNWDFAIYGSDPATNQQIRHALRNYMRGVQSDVAPYSFELPLKEPNSWIAVSGMHAHYWQIKNEQPQGNGVLYTEDFNWPTEKRDPRFASDIDGSWSPSSL